MDPLIVPVVTCPNALTAKRLIRNTPRTLDVNSPKLILLIGWLLQGWLWLIDLDQLETGLQNRWKTSSSNRYAASLLDFERILPSGSSRIWMILQFREDTSDVSDHQP